ncbi:hypothetical protein FACS189490_12050 [Clostridia bacterium]|nr:hypothetical protein FACS189490_12050 [Clostridia bacterium]
MAVGIFEDVQIYAQSGNENSAVNLRMMSEAINTAVNPVISNVAELTNTLAYPFNNSQATIALSPAKQSTDYVVLTETNDINGAVGNILISDKQNNGFKMAYTGSAASASINYIVLGGDE